MEKKAKRRWQVSEQVIILDPFALSGIIGTINEMSMDSEGYTIVMHQCKFPDLVVQFGYVGEYPR